MSGHSAIVGLYGRAYRLLEKPHTPLTRLEAFCPLLAISSFFDKHTLHSFISRDPFLFITLAVEVVAPMTGYEGRVSIPISPGACHDTHNPITGITPKSGPEIKY